MLHPRRSAQHVLLCDACETVPLQSHCELCNISLCTNCVGNHLLDSSRKHRVVPFIERCPKCPSHPDKHCKLYCEKCDIPVCSTCISSSQHEGHKLSEIMDKVSSKTQGLRKDLEELETSIYPRYEEIVSYVQTEKTEIETNYGKLTRAADQHGEVLHREITAIVNRRKSDIAEMKTKHLAVLKKSTDEITHNITELKQTIRNLKAILESNDVSLISTYKSRNAEFRRLPPKHRVTIPSLSPQKVKTVQLNKMVGSLPPLSIKKEQGYIMKSPEAAPTPPVKAMKSPEAAPTPPVKAMKSPEAAPTPPVKAMKSPEAAPSPPVKAMKSPEAAPSPPVKAMKSPEAESSPPVKPMKLPEAESSPPVKPMKSPEAEPYLPIKPMKSPEAAPSPPVKAMKSPEAESSPPIKPMFDEPQFTAAISTGYELLYSVRCPSDEQVWTCGYSKIMKLLNLHGDLLTSIQTESENIPRDIAVTRDGDLVYTDPNNNTVNLVRNKQIQIMIILPGWVPFYVCCTASGDLLVTMISDDHIQYIVARYSGSKKTQTILFDDQGNFLYSSNVFPKYITENRNLDICVADYKAGAVVVVNQSGKLRFRYTGHNEEYFDPIGITTDSQGHILTADSIRIHILDQDGQFLRFIDNISLRAPWGICVDTRDNLFVAERDSASVTKIQYL